MSFVLLHSVNWICIYLGFPQAFLISSIDNFKFETNFYYLYFCLHSIDIHLERTSCNLACIAVYRRLCWYHRVRFRHGGTDLTPLIDCNLQLTVFILISNNMCALLCTLVFYVWNVSTAKLRFGRCQPQVWQLPNQRLTAAKLKLGSWQELAPVNTYATLPLAWYGKWWLPEWKVHT